VQSDQLRRRKFITLLAEAPSILLRADRVIE
jgi:hypothetical protein